MRAKIFQMSVLFPILTIYTLVYLGLMVFDFAAREAFDVPAGMMVVYMALVGAYAADKEIRRWLGTGPQSRKGTIFVYLWLAFFLIAFVIHSFKKEFLLPADLSKVALQVLAVFFGSMASKKIYSMKNEGAQKETKTFLTQKDKILALITDKGEIKNQEVAEYLSVSSATSCRILDKIEEAGLIQQVGEGRGTHYILAESKK